MSEFTSSIVTVLLAIIGVAIIATLVSSGAQTANVLTAGGRAFSGILGAAEGPVTGGGGFGNLGNVVSGFTGGPTLSLY